LLNWAGIDAAGDSGVVGELAPFVAQAGGQYIAWIWSDGYVEADSGLGLSALGMLQLGVLVEYLAFNT
jgi:hypothetical protein